MIWINSLKTSVQVLRITGYIYLALPTALLWWKPFFCSLYFLSTQLCSFFCLTLSTSGLEQLNILNKILQIHTKINVFFQDFEHSHSLWHTCRLSLHTQQRETERERDLLSVYERQVYNSSRMGRCDKMQLLHAIWSKVILKNIGNIVYLG